MLVNIVLQGGVLNITDIMREDAGFYTVQGTNEEGKTNFTFKLNVQCKFLNTLVLL